MERFIAWCGFLGAWLLVAGPIYQATIELGDEELEREDIQRASASLQAPPRISRWWLLLPPVAYLLNVRRSRAYRQEFIDLLSETQVEQLLHFRETATAWLFVAFGAFLIAIKETGELREAYEWPDLVFWVGIVLMLIVCAANTVTRVKRRHEILVQARR